MWHVLRVNVAEGVGISFEDGSVLSRQRTEARVRGKNHCLFVPQRQISSRNSKEHAEGAVPTAELVGYNGKDHAALTYAAGPMET
jgi:hypothetical protein